MRDHIREVMKRSTILFVCLVAEKVLFLFVCWGRTFEVLRSKGVYFLCFFLVGEPCQLILFLPNSLAGWKVF